MKIYIIEFFENPDWNTDKAGYNFYKGYESTSCEEEAHKIATDYAGVGLINTLSVRGRVKTVFGGAFKTAYVSVAGKFQFDD